MFCRLSAAEFCVRRWVISRLVQSLVYFVICVLLVMRLS